MREAGRKYQKPRQTFRTDFEIVLECLHETYTLEGAQLLSGKNIYATMVHPFLKMAEGHCTGISMEEIHAALWKLYQEDGEKDAFVQRAGTAMGPYRKDEDSE